MMLITNHYNLFASSSNFYSVVNCIVFCGMGAGTNNCDLVIPGVPIMKILVASAGLLLDMLKRLKLVNSMGDWAPNKVDPGGF